MAQTGGPTRTTDSLAIVSLVLGIVGLVAIPLIPSIVAIVLGKKSQAQIAASGGTLEGEGLAKAGVIMGWIGIGLAILGLIAFVLLGIFAAVTINS